MKKILVLMVLSVGVFFALHVGYKGRDGVKEHVDAQQTLQTVRTVLNDVWDSANNQLMTTSWVGAQGVKETEETILNDVWDKDNHMLRVSGGVGAGTGDFSSNTATSVDGEAVVFSGTDGKVGKRFSGTGLVGATSGVLEVTNLSGDVTTSGGVATTVVKVDGVTYPASPSTNSIPLITAANTAVYKVIPDCDVAAGFLNYDTGTQAFTCGAFVPGSGDVSAVGSCITGDCFTAATPSGSLVFNNATSGTVTLQTVTGALGAVAVNLPAASDTLVGKATVDVLTNKTLNVESTGNVLTTVSKMWLPAASCVGTNAALMWDMKPSYLITAACLETTNAIKGVAQFPDTAFAVLEQVLMLPSDWVGVIDARILWLSVSTTGSVFWHVSVGCKADDEGDEGSVYNTSISGADVAKGTASRMNFFSIGSPPITGCAAGEMMHVAVFRDGDNVGDTLIGTASLVGVELTLRRAQ